MKSRFGVIPGSAWGSWRRPPPRALGNSFPQAIHTYCWGRRVWGRSPENASLGFDLFPRAPSVYPAWSGAESGKARDRRREAGSTRGPGWVAQKEGTVAGEPFCPGWAGLWATECKVFLSPLFSYSFLLLTQDLNLMFCKASHASFVFTGQRGCDGVFQDTLPSHSILPVLEIISKSKWPQGAQTQRNL